MPTEDTDAAQDLAEQDRAVLLYLQAVEIQRSAPQNLPQPDAAADALAGGAMVASDDRGGLEEELAKPTPGSDANVRDMEQAFVQAAADYGRRHHITYDGWRQAGVAPEVLEKAGIRPSDQ